MTTSWDAPAAGSGVAHAMPWWRRAVLAGHLGATAAYRRWALARAERLGTAPVIVLMYHRVADEPLNDWTISCAAFARQIDWVQSRFALISLAEARTRLASGRNAEAAVAVTFDDGYADNCRFALPLLLRRGVPVTYFVATRHILDAQPFPHDATAGRPLAPNTPDQLRELADAGVDIGAHTRTHADLGRIRDPKRLEDEIAGARRDLEQLLGRPPRHFAFPYGQHANMQPAAFETARRAGYDAVCSAYGGYNWPGGDPFHLQRIAADPIWLRFRNWLTVDPLKTLRLRPYRPVARDGRLD